MTVTKGNAKELYASLVESAKSEEMVDGEFTADDFAADVGISREVAYKKLYKKVDEGLLESRKANKEGRSVTAYKFKA